MASVQQLVDGLVARCKTISGLRCYAGLPPQRVTPSMSVVGPVRWVYDESMAEEGARLWRPVFDVIVAVGEEDALRGQQKLWTYLAPNGSQSIPAALYGDPTLGGVANDTRVLGGGRPPQSVEIGGGRQLEAALEVEVWTM
jgi:hypothetical protein